MSAPAEDVKDQGGWLCPIMGVCTKSTIHRRCPRCYSHCWDCCGRPDSDFPNAGCRQQCPEPPLSSINYELPDDDPK